MKKNLLSGIIAILLLMTGYVVKASSTISQGFNSTSISAGKKIWFSAVVNVSGTPTYPLTINFTNQVISSSAFSLSVPNGQLILDPTVTTATTVFNGSAWVTTVAPNAAGHYFISGYSDSLTTNISGGLNPVSWTGTFSTCGANVSISWEWAAAVYSSFNSNLNDLGVKPSDCTSCSAYSNSDHAGSPEHYMSHVITGATGSTSGGGGMCGSGSGTSYTGSYSASQSLTITGSSFSAAVCAGGTTTLNAGVSGGTWSSSNTSVASVNASGVLSGVSAGTARITYTTGGCTTAQTVTVNAAPTAGASSPASVCQGASLPLTGTTSGSTGGGTCGGGSGSGSSSTFSWQGPAGFTSASQNPTRTGMTTAMAGTYSFTVTNSNGCKATATTDVVVNSAPNAGTVNGASTICAGTTTTFNDAVSGGVWSTSAAGVATVNSGGVVTGVSAGTATISYKVTNSCGNAVATKVITISAAPNAGVLSGAASVCVGGSITIGHTGTGGTFNSGAAVIAIVSSGGVVTGVAAGTATIFYTVSNSCGTDIATKVVTVNALPTVSGGSTGTTCAGGTFTLIATPGGSGSGSGGSCGGGSGSGCGGGSGSGGSCGGGSGSGGWGYCGGGSGSSSFTWSGPSGFACGSQNPVRTGACSSMNGEYNVTYTDANGCQANATTTVNVNPVPNAGTITGSATICVGATTNMADAAAGGVWHSSAAGIASVSAAGVVTGVAAGTATISYVVTNSCGTATATKTITVIAAPSAGTVTGASNICAGSATTFADAVSGGVWSSGTTSIAAVSASGVVSGMTVGNATISYRVTNSCGNAVATKVISVGAAPSVGVITGGATACAGAVINMADATSGGVWSTSAPAIATVDASGVVTAVTAGTATVSYKVTNSCGNATATKVVTVGSLPNAGAITGSGNICAGATTSLVNAAGGGVWSSNATGIVTVSAAGVVTGVAAGAATISYVVTNSCGSAVTSSPVIVNALPDAGTISGLSAICGSATTTINNTVSGGVWSTSAAAVATVDASGVVTGVGAGSATISYTVANSCGTAVATTGVNVTPLPDAGVIAGSTALCAGATSALNNAASGGVWSIDASAIATIDASGVVTGVSAGVANVSYTVTNSCGSAVANGAITVNPLPNAGAIAGGTVVCAGATIAMNNTATGGVWSTSDATEATVDASGVVTGVAGGAATISYSVTNSCGTAIAIIPVNINSLPDAGTITGATIACMGTPAALVSTVSGGVWSADATGVVNIDATGVVTGISAGVANVSYTVTNSCGSSVATSSVTVAAHVDAGTISGGAAICAGTTTVLTSTVSGGVWSTGAASVATIDGSGVVTGVASGMATMTYTMTNSCGSASATAVINVNPLPNAGTITGNNACLGATNTLADAAIGGVWSTSDATTISVDASGVVTGVAVGNATITYTVANSCGTATATFPIAVNTIPPTAGAVIGFDSVCIALTATLSDSTSGGVWSTGDATRATVDTTGDVTGVMAGGVTISYTVSNGCGSVTASRWIHVKPLPDPGVITGASHVAYQATIVLTDSTSYGTWSTSNYYTTVDGGIVYGVEPGVSAITYALSNLCGTAYATKIVTVDSPTIGHLAPIQGTDFYACVGGTAGFFNSTSGGVFSIDSAFWGIATTTPIGVVTGVSAGTAILSYTYWGATTTSVITVYPLPNPIAGPSTVCNTASAPLSDATPGGVWSSGIPSTAIISTTGVVTAFNPGVVPMYYTLVAPAGCRAVFNMTVNPLPAGILGAGSLCAGSVVTLHDSTAGGVWSGSNSHATVDASGNVTGISPGGVTVSYTPSTGCSAIDILTIFPVPGPINGNLSVCNGAVTFVTDTSSVKLSWTSSTPSVAIVSPSGAVEGMSVGTSVITYTKTTGCYTTAVVTVNPVPVVTSILGASSVSVSGGPVTLSDLTPGGIWSSSNSFILNIGSATGMFTPTFVGTNATVYYTVTNSYGCSGQVSSLISITAAPHSHGSATTTVGATITIADEAIAGDWSTSDNAVATVDNNGVVTAIAAGHAMITHTTTGNGAVSETVTDVTVNALPFDVKLFPSPNNGAFSVTGIAGTDKDVNVTIEVTNMLGQVVYTSQSVATAGLINNQVSIGSNLTTGNYVLIASNGTENKTIHFVIEK